MYLFTLCEFLCTHCLKENISPLNCSVFTMEEIEAAREQRSFMICGESGKKVAINSLSPELQAISSNRIDQVMFFYMLVILVLVFVLIFNLFQIEIEQLVSVRNLGQGAFSTVYLSKFLFFLFFLSFLSPLNFFSDIHPLLKK